MSSFLHSGVGWLITPLIECEEKLNEALFIPQAMMGMYKVDMDMLYGSKCMEHVIN